MSVKLIPVLAFLVACFWPLEGHARQFQAGYYSHASLIEEGTRRPNEAQVMANGKLFDENALTCATRDYPLGAMLRITNKSNGKSVTAVVVVVVTDRIGKRFKGKRVDLSLRAFQMLDSLSKGVIFVDIERVF